MRIKSIVTSAYLFLVSDCKLHRANIQVVLKNILHLQQHLLSYFKSHGSIHSYSRHQHRAEPDSLPRPRFSHQVRERDSVSAMFCRRSLVRLLFNKCNSDVISLSTFNIDWVTFSYILYHIC
jgi:hypothetical protein